MTKVCRTNEAARLAEEGTQKWVEEKASTEKVCLVAATATATKAKAEEEEEQKKQETGEAARLAVE